MKKYKITLLMPVLNEVESLRVILPTIPKNLFHEVVVVDGGSKDGTIEYLMENNIRIITQKRKGLAFGLVDAISELNTDYVITFSPDGNCKVQELKPLIDEIQKGYDLIVVSRYLPPAKSLDDDFITKFGNFMFSLIINFMGKNRVTDSLNIYRAYRVELIKDEMLLGFLYGPVLEPLLTAYINVKKMSYKEIPGDEPKRIFGERKMRVIYNGSCILLMVIRLYVYKFFLMFKFQR